MNEAFVAKARTIRRLFCWRRLSGVLILGYLFHSQRSSYPLVCIVHTGCSNSQAFVVRQQFIGLEHSRSTGLDWSSFRLYGRFGLENRYFWGIEVFVSTFGEEAGNVAFFRACYALFDIEVILYALVVLALLLEFKVYIWKCLQLWFTSWLARSNTWDDSRSDETRILHFPAVVQTAL